MIVPSSLYSSSSSSSASSSSQQEPGPSSRRIPLFLLWLLLLLLLMFLMPWLHGRLTYYDLKSRCRAPSLSKKTSKQVLFRNDVEGYSYRSYQYVLRVGYDGSLFNGFQAQRHRRKEMMVPTVQQTIEGAIAKILKIDVGDVHLRGASRTDVGVHARDQVVSFYSHRCLDEGTLQRALNAVLPDSLQVYAAEWVPPDFHPLIHIKSKTYEYKVYSGAIMQPVERFDKMHMPNALDMNRMLEAAKVLVGQHDFIHYSSMKSATLAKRKVSTIKTVENIAIEPVENGLVFTVKGRGFLYHQVRHIVGAILAAGRNRFDVSYLSEMLNPQGEFEHHSPKWRMCPAEGLCLREIELMPLPQPTVLIHPELPHDEDGRVYVIPKEGR